MRFLELAEVFGKLEATPKRLEMRALLSALLRPLKPPELSTVVYLSQGLLRPEYEAVELGVAGSLARRALALVTSLRKKRSAVPRAPAATSERPRRSSSRVSDGSRSLTRSA